MQKLKVLIVGRDEPRICDQCFPQILLEPQNTHFPPSTVSSGGKRKTVCVWHLLLRQCADRSYHAKRKTWMWIVEHFRLRQRISVGFCVRALYTPWIQCAEQGNRLGYFLKHFYLTMPAVPLARPLRDLLHNCIITIMNKKGFLFLYTVLSLFSYICVENELKDSHFLFQ